MKRKSYVLTTHFPNFTLRTFSLYLRHFAFGMSSLTYGEGEIVCVCVCAKSGLFMAILQPHLITTEEDRVAFQIQLMCV